jgi:hypothetical protein
VVVDFQLQFQIKVDGSRPSGFRPSPEIFELTIRNSKLQLKSVEVQFEIEIELN